MRTRTRTCIRTHIYMPNSWRSTKIEHGTQTNTPKKTPPHEHKVQQHKTEITMTHLMKADFQFYLFYIYSVHSLSDFWLLFFLSRSHRLQLTHTRHHQNMPL